MKSNNDKHNWIGKMFLWLNKLLVNNRGLSQRKGAKVHVTNCETEKGIANVKDNVQLAKYKSEIEWSTFAEPLSREIEMNSWFHRTIR